MGNTAAYVTTGKPNPTGAVFVAPKGTALPSTAEATLSDAYVCLGHVSESGLQNNNELSMSEIKTWGGTIVYRSLNGLNDAFTLALLEVKNVDVLKSVYGEDNVSVDGSGNITVEVAADDPTEMVWIFDLALRDETPKRIIVPDGAITAREAITYNDSDAVAYGITVSAYPYSGTKTHKELTVQTNAPSI